MRETLSANLRVLLEDTPFGDRISAEQHEGVVDQPQMNGGLSLVVRELFLAKRPRGIEASSAGGRNRLWSCRWR